MTNKPTAPVDPAVPATPAAEPGQFLAAHTVDGRPYSPGLEGVLAAETELGLVDGTNGRLMYRGYRIGDLVAHGSYASVANLLWTGEWNPHAHMSTGRVPSAVMAALMALPRTASPGPRADRPRSQARPRLGLPLPAHRPATRQGNRPRPRRLLHRGR